MKLNSFLKPFLLGLIAFFVVSCDKDFNEIGADFVDNDHYNFTSEKFDVLSFNQALGPVQTNNLPLNPLGYYTNPVFGKTKASFVTQLELETADPKFYDVTLADIDSVYLHVPYFVKADATNSDGDTTYKPLDSLYGNPDGKIKLNLYKSNYYLRSLDTDLGLLEPQRYYSSQKGIFDANHDAARLNDRSDALDQNDNFQFKNTQIKFYKTDTSGNLITPLVVRERLAPGMYMDLNKQFFFNNIINAPAGKLMDNNVFKDWFRGLYFNVEDHADNPNHSALNLINFAQGKIVIVYHGRSSTTDTAAKKRKVMTLKMSGNRVSLLENNYTAAYTSALASASPTTGDSKLYLKGGEGSMAIIDLFGGAANDNSVDLNRMRSENWLINEANLVFTIDNNTTNGMGLNDIDLEPNRIFLYDYNNKRPLIDYYYDSSTNSNPKFNKLVHSGIIQKVSLTERGTKYKIRITNHIRNLVKFGGANVVKDSTNVRLGLVVTESINSEAFYKVQTPSPYTGANSKFVSAMSIINPLGTILFGNNVPSSNVNYDKRVRLEIVYTKPD